MTVEHVALLVCILGGFVLGYAAAYHAFERTGWWIFIKVKTWRGDIEAVEWAERWVRSHY